MVSLMRREDCGKRFIRGPELRMLLYTREKTRHSLEGGTGGRSFGFHRESSGGCFRDALARRVIGEPSERESVAGFA